MILLVVLNPLTLMTYKINLFVKLILYIFIDCIRVENMKSRIDTLKDLYFIPGSSDKAKPGSK